MAGVLCCLIAAPVQTAHALDTIAHARRDLNGDFFPDNTNTYYEVNGRITADGFSDTAVRIFIQDVNDNAGIMVRGNTLVAPDRIMYPVGVDVLVFGRVGQENGLRHMILEYNYDMQRVDAGQSPAPLLPLTRTIAELLANPEHYEGSFVRIANTTITAGS